MSGKRDEPPCGVEGIVVLCKGHDANVPYPAGMLEGDQKERHTPKCPFFFIFWNSKKWMYCLFCSSIYFMYLISQQSKAMVRWTITRRLLCTK